MSNEESMERLVAEIPQSLKRRVHIQAVQEGKSLKDVVIEALEKWLTDSEKKEPAKMTTIAA